MTPLIRRRKQLENERFLVEGDEVAPIRDGFHLTPQNIMKQAFAIARRGNEGGEIERE